MTLTPPVATAEPRRALWHNADFRRLWMAITVSIFGSLIGRLAVQFTAVISLGAGPLGLGALAVCQFAPPFLVAPWAGVIADRGRRRPLMIAADLARFAALATIPLAAVTDLLTLWHLCAVSVATSTLNTLFDVAYEAHFPALVGRDAVVEANSKVSASASVAEVGSFGIAGWLVQAITGPGAILVDACSFLWSAFFLRRISAVEPPPAHDSQRQHPLREAVAGLSLVWRQPVLRALGISNVLLAVAPGIFSVAFILYLVDDLGFSPGVLGMIFGIGGLSSLAGAFVAARPGRYHLGRALCVSLVLRALGMAFLPFEVSAWGYASLILAQLVTDPAWLFYEVHEVSLRQALTEDSFLGRMNATMRLGGFGGQLAGIGAGVVLTAVAGVLVALFFAAAVNLVAAVYLFLGPVARVARPPDLEVVANEA